MKTVLRAREGTYRSVITIRKTFPAPAPPQNQRTLQRLRERERNQFEKRYLRILSMSDAGNAVRRMRLAVGLSES